MDWGGGSFWNEVTPREHEDTQLRIGLLARASKAQHSRDEFMYREFRGTRELESFDNFKSFESNHANMQQNARLCSEGSPFVTPALNLAKMLWFVLKGHGSAGKESNRL